MSKLPLETATNAEKLGIRATLGLGTEDLPTLRGLSLARDASNSVSVEVGTTGNVISTYVGTQPGVQHLATRDGTFAFEVRNTSTGNNANAVIIAQTLGLGDAYTRYTIPSGSWTAGLDNSDADKYKIGVGSTVNLETWFEISATGASRFFGSVDLQRTSDSTNFERLGMRWDGFDAKIGTTKGGTGGPRDLVFEADGTERLRVTAAGELRTSSTLYFSATEDFATRRNLTNLDFVLPSGGTGSFRFRNGLSGHIPFLINQSGNVGINTQSPSHRLDVVGSIRASQPIIFPTYTVATAPVGASYIGGMIYVSDEAGGPTMAFYDGTNWRRVQDRAIISLPA
jgi:hypothetical protein